MNLHVFYPPLFPPQPSSKLFTLPKCNGIIYKDTNIRSGTKWLKNQPCDVIRMIIQLFLGVFYLSFPLISLIFMTYHGWFLSYLVPLQLFMNVLLYQCKRQTNVQRQLQYIKYIYINIVIYRNLLQTAFRGYKNEKL